MAYRAQVVFDMWAPNACVTRPLMFTAARTAARAECHSSGNGKYVVEASTIGNELKIPTPSSCVSQHQPIHPSGAQCMAKTPVHVRPVRLCNSSMYVLNWDWSAS